MRRVIVRIVFSMTLVVGFSTAFAQTLSQFPSRQAGSQIPTMGSYHNSKYAYSVEFPRPLLIPQGESDAGDGQRFASKDGSFKMSVWGQFNVLDKTLAKECDERIESDRKDNSLAVTYKALKGTVCAYSGLAGSTIIYQKTVFLDDTFKTVRLEYPKANKEAFDSIVNRIVSSFP